jgi:cytochrome c oxidase assembly protein subunit 19
MARDEFKNLGFKEERTPAQQAEGSETGVKGELRW